jgi:hypothetical protein
LNIISERESIPAAPKHVRKIDPIDPKVIDSVDPIKPNLSSICQLMVGSLGFEPRIANAPGWYTKPI